MRIHKRILSTSLIVAVILVIQSCDNAPAWYEGAWSVKPNQETNDPMVVSMLSALREQIIVISDNEIIISNAGTTKKVIYRVLEQDKNRVKLEGDDLTIDMGRDDNGVYLIGNTSVKWGNEPAVVTEFKLYLEKLNE